jgi:hypothetical protein
MGACLISIPLDPLALQVDRIGFITLQSLLRQLDTVSR